MKQIATLSISAKISIGFLTVLALAGVICAVALVSLGDLKNVLVEYRTLVEETNEAAGFRADVLTNAVAVKNYVVAGSADTKKVALDGAEVINARLRSLSERITDAERRAAIEVLLKDLQEYDAAFTALVERQEAKARSVSKMQTAGGVVTENFSAMMQTTNGTGNAQLTFAAGNLIQEFSLAVGAADRFVLTSNDATLREATARLDRARTQLDAFAKSTSDATLQWLTSEAGTTLDEYVAAFKMATNAILDRDDIQAGTVEPLVAHMTEAAAAFNHKVVTDQTALGGRAIASIQNSRLVTLIATGLAILVGLLASWLIGRMLSRPILAMVQAMTSLAEGNTKVVIPAADRKDEVGRMAAAVEVFRASMERADALAAEQETMRRRTEGEQRQLMCSLADDFERTVAGTIGKVADASTELASTAQEMSASAERANEQTAVVAGAAEHASSNVQTVATAAEELSASISEIAHQVAQSAGIATNAVAEAARTNELVQSLSDASSRIGEVINLINAIASQTNLLALNATIEAARAGDAGKGFAVVASEVKSLAGQTAHATNEIESQIAMVQAATRDAVAIIETIGGRIGQLNEIASVIAAAVEQQGAATREIARNINQAATGTEDVSANIGAVHETSAATGQAADKVLLSAQSLSQEADSLQRLTRGFLDQIRAT